MSDDAQFVDFLRYFVAEYRILSVAIVAVLVWLFIRPDFWRRLMRGSDDDASAASGDPVAEADLYLAYDQYEEAARALRRSIASKPPSPELMHKLLEVYFSGRMAEDFVNGATYYKREFGRGGHWNSICEMGRQLLPEERLFR